MPWRGRRARPSLIPINQKAPNREPFSRPAKAGARCRSIHLSTPTILTRGGSSVRHCASPSIPPPCRTEHPAIRPARTESTIGSFLGKHPTGRTVRMIGSCRPAQAPAHLIPTTGFTPKIGSYQRRPPRAPHSLRQARSPTSPVRVSLVDPRLAQIPLRPIGRSFRRAASARWPGIRRSFPIRPGNFS
jgi:hypothetical protein